MVLTPKVTCEDVRLALNGSASGSTYYTFWDQTISSGSILAQINLANYWMYGILGKTVMESTDEITSYHVNTCQLDYSCMRVLIILSGGVITEGFNWNAGINVSQPAMLPTYKNLIQEFSFVAQNHLRAIQPLAVSAESDIPAVGKTATSVM